MAGGSSRLYNPSRCSRGMPMECSRCGSTVETEEVRVSVTPVEVRPEKGYNEGKQYIFHPECWVRASEEWTARFAQQSGN